MKEKYKYERIEEERKKTGKTQAKIAEEIKMHTTQYRRYEKGETEIPSNMLIRICKFFNVSADYILGLTDEYKTLD